MFFIKKLFLGLAAVVLIYLGGSGTQSSNMLFQGGGFIGIIVGLVVLYIFGKMVWRAMGCLPVLLIISLIVGFILYAEFPTLYTAPASEAKTIILDLLMP